MRLQIKSRKTGEVFNFWAPDEGGYIRLETDNNIGILGQQICESGKKVGNTLTCSRDSFSSNCRRWYRQHMKALSNAE